MEENTTPESSTLAVTPLEAKSPFELRVNLGKGVLESEVRSALATGDMGFLQQLGVTYSLEDTEPPSIALVEQACGVFRSAGLATY
jgi:hypothetical protein